MSITTDTSRGISTLIKGGLFSVLSLAFLFLTLAASAQPFGQAGVQTVVPISATGALNRGYFEYLPRDYDASDPTKQYPLILFFHGKGEEGNGTDIGPLNAAQPGLGKMVYNFNSTTQESTQRSATPPGLIMHRGKHYDAIVISIQNANAWVPGRVTKNFYDWIMARYPIDPDQVYVTGLSAGGVASINFLSTNPEVLAGVLIHETAGRVDFPLPGSKEVPVWAHYNYRGSYNRTHQKIMDSLANLQDGTSYLDLYPKPYVAGRDLTFQLEEGVQWNTPEVGVNAPTGRLAVTTYGRGGHSGWARMYEDASGTIFGWLLSQRRGTTALQANINGPATVQLPQSSTSLTAITTSSSSITTYQWSVAAGSTLQLSGADTETVTLSGLVAGNHLVTVAVTNADGQTTSQQLNLNVLAPEPLTAMAGEDFTVFGNTAEVDGSLSTGPVASYAWSWLTQPAGSTAQMATPQAAQTAISPLALGTYQLALTVTDTEGNQDQDTLTITVNQDPLPPYGAAGQQVAVTQDVPNGLNHGFFEYLPQDYDATDTNKRYPLMLFFHGAGQKGDGSAILGPTETQTGLGKFIYDVNDNNALRAEDPPSLIANAGRHYQAIVISVQYSGPWVSSANSKAVYEWVKAHYPIDTNRVYFTGLSAGGFSALQLLANEPQIPAAVLVHETASKVYFPNEAAKQVPLWAHYNIRGSFNKPHQIIFDSLADIGDGTSFLDAFPKPIVIGNHYTRHLDAATGWSDFEPGIVTPSRTQAVTVYGRSGHLGWNEMYQDEAILGWLYSQQKGGNTAPSISVTAPSPVSVQLPQATVTLTAQANTTDGSAVSYLWSQVAGTPLTLSGANAADLVLSGLVAGDFTFRVIASSPTAGADSTEVVLSVLPFVAPLVANAGPDQQIMGSTTTLSAANSTGPIDSYAWTYLAPAVGSESVYVNFTANVANATAAAPWNNYTNGFAAGDRADDLADENGHGTTVDLVFENGWTSDNRFGVLNGDFPNEVSRYFYYFSNDGVSRVLRLEGLDDNLAYDLTLYNGANFGDPGEFTTAFSVGTDTVRLDPALNRTQTVTLTDLAPSSGTLALHVSTTAVAGSISALILTPKVTTPVPPVLATPQAITTTVSGLTPGDHWFQLTVTDDQGNADQDSVLVTVLSQQRSFGAEPFAEQLALEPMRQLNQVHIFRPTGRKVDTLPIREGSSLQSVLLQVPSGFYILKLEYQDGSVETRKILKQ
ncbi:MAG: alpha/beta hydrolase-fold protein [Bacteroidota bacterium]